MKKRPLFYFTCIVAILGASFITSCNDDDYPGAAPDEITAQYGNKLADGERANLTLTYSGEELIGKSVNLETSDSRTATLTLLNVLPHEAKTPLSITLTPDNNGSYSFNGNGQSALGTAFNYTGIVQKGNLTLAIKDVQIPANPLTTTGKMSLVASGNAETDSSYKVKPDDRWATTWKTAHASGTGSLSIEIGEDASMDIGSLVGGLAGNFFKTVLNEVKFGADGNITADYAAIPDTLDIIQDLLGGKGILNRPASDWKASPVNLASYYVVDDTTLYVVPNVDMIIRQIRSNQTSTRSILDLIGSLGDVYAMLNKWSSTGIKLIVKKQTGEYAKTTSSRPTYMRNEGDYTIAINKDEIEPIFSLLKSLPDEIKDISLGTVPLLGELKVGLLTDMLGNASTFNLTFYFNKVQQ